MDPIVTLHDQLKGLFPGVLGIEFIEATPDRVVARLTVRPDLCTVGGTLHGGAIMAFADTLGAVGAFLNLPPGARTTTIESKTNFLGAAPVGSEVVAESLPLHRGKTTNVWQTRLTLANGKPVAIVIQTQLVLTA